MSFKFVKTGEESKKAAQQAQIEQERRREAYGKLWRFRLDPGEDASLTFIDGDLDENGFLVPPRWYEHQLFLNGQWQNILCPEKTNPESGDKCPIEQSGDISAIVSGFTVIDHRQGVSSKGNPYKDTRKTLVAKPKSFDILAKYAVKLGGLACASFDVSRTKDTDPNVGNIWIFKEKLPLEELKKKYVKEITDPKTNKKSTVSYFFSADFNEEIIYRTGDELRAMGLGKPVSTNNDPPWGNGQKQPGKTNYADQL